MHPANTVAAQRRGKRKRRPPGLRSPWLTWGSRGADLRDPASPGCACAPSQPLHPASRPTEAGPGVGGGRGAPRRPLPAAQTPTQRAASWRSNFNPRKVPIVHLQSCFKVTLISKLLAALAGDYSCINQGEIMPVTD